MIHVSRIVRQNNTGSKSEFPAYQKIAGNTLAGIYPTFDAVEGEEITDETIIVIFYSRDLCLSIKVSCIIECFTELNKSIFISTKAC